MTSTTTAAERIAARRRKRNLVLWGVSITGWVFGLSVLLHVAGLGVLWKADFLGSKIVFNPEEEAKRTEEVARREEERKKLEEREREHKQLPEEHAQKLKAEAERKAERELAKKVEDLRRTKEELEAIEARKLAELQQRPEEAYRRKQAEAYAQKAKELARSAEGLHKVAPVLPTEQTKWASTEAAAKAEEFAKALEQQLAVPAASEQAAAADRAGEALVEKARNAAEHARQAVAQTPPERRGWAESVAKTAEQLAQEAAQLVGAPLDMSAFNDTSAAEAPPQVSDEQLQDLQAKPAEELYDLAQKLEQDASQAYADARAAELALRQNSTFAEAKEKLAVSTPQRPDLSQQLAGEQVGNVGQLNEYREALGQAVTQAESMRVAAGNQLAQAQGIDPGAGAAAQASAQSRYAQMMAMQQGARMGEGQRSLDLSGLMRAGAMTMAGIAGSGDSVIYANSNLEAGSGYVGAEKMPALNLRKEMITAQALPGRKFDKESARQGWLYIDTWYIIGPFETKGDVRHREAFPPEYEIDFDATYPGKLKDGKPRELRWQFTQSDMIRVTPPDEQRDSAYYAFTELYFEDDSDMLLAIASDDAAKVWINELLVWEDKDLSPWNIGEGFRKVFFRKGYNKVLVRIDNGPVVCQFSVLICPPEALAAR